MVLGCGVALLIFLLIPFTQFLEPIEKTPVVIEELELAVLPPPPPLEEPPPPLSDKQDESPPELEMPPPMPTLEQLEVGLNPGKGGDFAIEAGFSIHFETESAAEMMQRYGFDDLDEVPHVTRRGPLEYPVQLLRRRIEGYVKVLVYIDPSGRVEVKEVMDYSHKQFVAPARRTAAATRYSPPVRDGKPVSAQYLLTVEFKIER